MLSEAEFEARVDRRAGLGPKGECHEWARGVDTYGYGQWSIDGRSRLAHRVAWEIYYGEIPNGLHVLHTCDHPRCIRREHLFLGTHAENMADKNAKGRLASKLKAPQVRAVRQELKMGKYTQREIARMFGVSEAAISMLKHGKTWSHVA